MNHLEELRSERGHFGVHQGNTVAFGSLSWTHGNMESWDRMLESCRACLRACVMRSCRIPRAEYYRLIVMMIVMI